MKDEGFGVWYVSCGGLEKWGCGGGGEQGGGVGCGCAGVRAGRVYGCVFVCLWGTGGVREFTIQPDQM